LCGFWCTPFGTLVSVPSSIDVTLSGVIVGSDISGTYTLLRNNRFGGSANLYTYYSGNTGYLVDQYLIGVEFSPRSANKFSARVGVTLRNASGYIGAIWSHLEDELSIPTCCPFSGAVSLALESGYRGAPATNGTAEVHCD
jgi:hypothetical protein